MTGEPAVEFTDPPGRHDGGGRALDGVRDCSPGPARQAPGGFRPRPGLSSPALGADGEDAAPSPGTGDGAALRSWTVTLPAGLELLSLNDREHHMARHRTFQSLKKAAWAMLVNARLPRLDRVTVRVIYDPPDRRPRDPDNLAATVKPLVDAIVAAGIIPDDTSAHVAWAHGEIGTEVRKPSRLRIVIAEALPVIGDKA